MKKFEIVLQKLIDAEVEKNRLRADVLKLVDDTNAIELDKLLAKIEQLERINFDLSSEIIQLKDNK